MDLYAITTKTFTATFVANGATSIGSTSLSCTTLGTSCIVRAPSITRSGYTIVGWNTSATATTAQYVVGSNITLTSNITLNAITTKTFTATFVANGATSIGSTSLSCTTLGTSCIVQAPSITRSGYTIVGWNTSATATTAQYTVGSNIALTSNITLNAITKASTYTCKSVAYLTSDGYNDSLVKFTCPSGQYFDSYNGGCWVQAGNGTDTKYGTQYSQSMNCISAAVFCTRINCTGGGTAEKCVDVRKTYGGTNKCNVTYRLTCWYESSGWSCPTGYELHGDRCGNWDAPVLSCIEGFESDGYCYKYGQSSCPSGWTKIAE